MVNIEYLHLLTPPLPRVGDMNQYESGGPADRACPQLLTNPSVDPAFINTLTPLFQKVSMQRIMTEGPLTFPVMHKQVLSGS